MRTHRTKWYSKLYLGLIVAFLQLPIIIMMINSFNSSRAMGAWTWEGFTLDWYRELISNDKILSSLGTTLLLALAAAVISTIIGTIAAIGLSGMKKRISGIILNVSYIPMLNAEIVMGISLMLLFAIIGIDRGFLTLLIGHITFCIPYVILSVMPKIRQFDHSKYEAALDLGATPKMAIVRIFIPDILPGIISGFLMAFTLSMDDFIISFFTTGNGVKTLPIEIYTMMTKRGISPEVNALSTIVYIIVFIIMLGINVLPSIRQRADIKKKLKSERKQVS
ncbi:MAG: ABC transporter permease [Clostridia bacterium]|nr:ABC transporter permease [Clostridia bacterium]